MTNSGLKRRLVPALTLALGLAAVTGCHKKTAPLPPQNAIAPASVAAPTATIAADPLVIELGQSVVLNWRTTDATSVSIDGIGQVNVNGTQTVSPSNSTNFHLVARGDGGTTDANVRVTVRVGTMPTAPANSGSEGGDMGTDAEFHANVQDVFFGYDSFDVPAESQGAIDSAARYLNAHPAIRLTVGGYCDERGSAEYNLTLGENRANAAKTALVSAGVSASRIRTISYGKERQFCSEADESCYQQNRRAQFQLDR